MSTGILLSCEHGGREVPPSYQHLFARQPEVLDSHRGWDPGTLVLGRFLADILSVPLVYSTTTRLLIEMNRSLESPQLFSEFSDVLPFCEKEKLIAQYYFPYRKAVQQEIDSYHLKNISCAHFSLHSFTPLWQGQLRKMDVGLLYDPGRCLERDLCEQLKTSLQKALPDLRICFNEPYLGTDDGLTTSLRKRYKDTDYAGVEIEINQKWIEKPAIQRIHNALLDALHQLVVEGVK